MLVLGAALFSTGGAAIKGTTLGPWEVAGLGVAFVALLLLVPAARRDGGGSCRSPSPTPRRWCCSRRQQVHHGGEHDFPAVAAPSPALPGPVCAARAHPPARPVVHGCDGGRTGAVLHFGRCAQRDGAGTVARQPARARDDLGTDAAGPAGVALRDDGGRLWPPRPSATRFLACAPPRFRWVRRRAWTGCWSSISACCRLRSPKRWSRRPCTASRRWKHRCCCWSSRC